MSRRHIFTTMIFLLAASGSMQVEAAAQRTFVASYGSDINLCTRTAPCRSFAAAIAATSSQGEVVVLDSAGYGPVSITQAISIIAPAGVYAGVSVLTDDGVVVAAGVDDKVALRGLTINGQGGASGITISSAAEVSIDNCVVTNMTDTGIFVNFATGNPRIQIRETLVRGNGGAGLWISGNGAPSVQVSDSQFVLNGGDSVHPSGGILASSGVLNAQRVVANDNATFGVLAASDTAVGVVVTLSDSEISHNGTGGAVATAAPVTGGTATLTVVRSTIAGNGGNGLVADGTAASAAMTVVASDMAVAENSGGGIVAIGATANALVTRSAVTRNVGPDLVNAAGVLRSGGNNTLTGRGAADVQGTITANPPQ